ncbi:hypothetical protein EBE87_13745 [Pseudoroseomonas wenyumeiae]|uniref:Uncharacterized protein n=1 Tax=Teichococcus wenyumeiae TaxID=2478470 RepID=A0A3A9JDH5_9PROT|nr:hypothetical protein [Pseudoroseomonas wenyumeiae]RKK04582.1 hypothetical protein D6Z83_08735 [Pseudoroseomonas wenyumeiae]RMI20878.1 hypothetical protein EBE87_13745 [Pseudoroseomonas wenyumeiae]
MSFAALSPEIRRPPLSLALRSPAAEPEPPPALDWAAELNMALPPLPESLPPVIFSLPPGGGDPYERLLAALSGKDGKADSVWSG